MTPSPDALQHEVRLLRTMIDTIPAMVAYLDREYRFLNVNLAYATHWGLEVSDIVGRHAAEIVGEEFFSKVEGNLVRVLDGEDVQVEMPMLEIPTGQWREKEVTYGPDRNAAGEITGINVLITDITQRKELERQNQHRQTHLQYLFHAGRMGIWEWDLLRDRVTWSPQLYEIFGYAPNSIVPTHSAFLDLIHPNDREHFIEVIKSAETGTVVNHQLDFRVKHGQHEDQFIWIHCRGNVELDQAGRPISITSVASDVTAKHEDEQKLRDTTAKLRALFDQSYFYMGVMDLEGNLIDVNDCALEPFGYQREDVLGKPFWDTQWWSQSEKSQRILKQSFQIALQGQVFRRDLPFTTPDGQKRISDFLYVPATDDEGKVIFVVCNGSDVTDQRRTERELKLAKARLEVGIKVGRLGIADVDYTTGMVHMSAQAAQLYGLSKEEIEVSREKFHSSFFAEDLDIMERRIEEILKPDSKTRAIVCEHRVMLPDGTVRWLEVCKEVYSCDDEGRPLRSIIAARDVTSFKDIQNDLQEAAKQALSANNAKSAFLASMSHEIRTPMTAILGYADLLTSSSLDDAGREYVRIIRRNGQFLLDIINDILDLSKIEAGKLEVAMEPVNPAKILEDIRSIMDVRAKEEKLRFSISFADKIPARILSDAKRLKQILFNLVGNAIKFTSEGEVNVIVKYLEAGYQQGDPTPALEIKVQDTGIGISDSLRSQLFAPFTQGHVEIDRQYGGTGLGLAISRRLARLIGGEIELTSVPGKGSEFTVYIPVGLDDLELVAVNSNPNMDTVSDVLAEPFDLPIHALVVDDRRDIRLLAKTVLAKNGATVDEAEDGEHALDRYARSTMDGRSYDLILLDMQMPRLDGFQTAARLRNMGCTIPIIALTAEAMHGSSNRCIEAGCDAYLSKPINFASLLATINDVLKK